MATRSTRRPSPAWLTSRTVRSCRPRISTARLASRSPPGVNASPDAVRVKSRSSNSLRSWATCIDTAASLTPSSLRGRLHRAQPRHAREGAELGGRHRANLAPAHEAGRANRGRRAPSRPAGRPRRSTRSARMTSASRRRGRPSTSSAVRARDGVLGAAGALGQVGRVVGDEQEGAARREGVERRCGPPPGARRRRAGGRR